ncbi:MAG: hypothetical protein QXL18_05240 [Candidatus Woesearchaeota archaeon]
MDHIRFPPHHFPLWHTTCIHFPRETTLGDIIMSNIAKVIPFDLKQKNNKKNTNTNNNITTTLYFVDFINKQVIHKTLINKKNIKKHQN